MDRRTALKQATFLIAGTTILPSCMFDSDRVSLALNNLDIQPELEKLLAEIAETIIPPTDTPGAKELNVHHFVLVMVDDCQEKPDRFASGLKQFDPFTHFYYEKSFAACSRQEREELIAGILEQNPVFSRNSKTGHEEVREFLSLTKQYTIQGYLKSQYVMTEIFPYQLVPGHFTGCVNNKS